MANYIRALATKLHVDAVAAGATMDASGSKATEIADCAFSQTLDGDIDSEASAEDDSLL